MLLCVCRYKSNRFIVNSNQRPNNSVTNSESFEVIFFPGMMPDSLMPPASMEYLKCIFFIQDMDHSVTVQ